MISNRVLRVANLIILSLLIVAVADGPAIARVAQAGGGHVLYGDFKVDEDQTGEMKPMTFQIILYSITGNIFSRQTISSNGRYRFLDVPNGEYDIVVEVENNEVTRVHILLAEPFKTDIRRDINLE